MVTGGASVTLIATLESLTVSAAPTASVTTAPGRELFADAGSLAITTSWAVPANLTTIRMACFAGGESRMVYVQRAGESNRAFTRTDTLHVENWAPAAPAQQFNSHQDRLSIVVQAL
jgi:hypothetical protein